jgi:hypothetical protein
MTPDEIRVFAGGLMDRSFHPAGVKRHFLAVMGTGNIKSLSTPYSCAYDCGAW